MGPDFPIIDKLGGRDEVRAELKRRGLLKSRDAIRMWVARGRIPGASVTALWAIARARGIGVEPEDMLLPTPTSEAA